MIGPWGYTLTRVACPKSESETSQSHFGWQQLPQFTDQALAHIRLSGLLSNAGIGSCSSAEQMGVLALNKESLAK